MEKEMWLWTRTGEREIILKNLTHFSTRAIQCSSWEDVVDVNAVTGQYRGRRKRRSCCQIWASPVFSKSQDTLQSHCQGCGGGWNLPNFSLHTCSSKPSLCMSFKLESNCRESHEDSEESMNNQTKADIYFLVDDILLAGGHRSREFFVCHHAAAYGLNRLVRHT